MTDVGVFKNATQKNKKTKWGLCLFWEFHPLIEYLTLTWTWHMNEKDRNVWFGDVLKPFYYMFLNVTFFDWFLCYIWYIWSFCWLQFFHTRSLYVRDVKSMLFQSFIKEMKSRCVLVGFTIRTRSVPSQVKTGCLSQIIHSWTQKTLLYNQ